MPLGFDDADWRAAQEEARQAMIGAARRRAMLTYSELFGLHVKAIALAPSDPRVAAFLDEISRAEDQTGRGMLSVVVVHKHGDMEPGEGFFTLAQQLGRDTRDRQAFWVSELHQVHAAWMPK